ncbi:hypothetical protein NMG60_11008632 [Bertholletia excelsa]
MAMVRLRFFVAFLLSLCLLSLSIQATDVHYCNKKTKYAVEVSGVDISPDPIARGEPATFNISASAGEAISGGRLIIEVSYFGFHIHTESHDLCAETTCPVSAGDFVISHSQVLPGFTPPGPYTLVMKMEDGNNHQLTCITFDFSIGFIASKAVADI